MPVIRVNKTADYTVMSNHHFRERGMSLKAKGLLSLMLSLPDDWDYSIKGLCTLTADGYQSVMTGLQELERFGYLKRSRLSGEGGKFGGWVYDVFEEPKTEKPKSEKPKSENPITVTNRNNNYKSNTKKSRTKEDACARAREDHPVSEEVLDEDLTAAVVQHLNEKAGVSFRISSRTTRRHIAARIGEGYTLDDFYSVIDAKVAEWRGTKLAPYLRPETLFGSKFESYLQQAKAKPPEQEGKTYELDDFFQKAVERTKRKRGTEK